MKHSSILSLLVAVMVALLQPKLLAQSDSTAYLYAALPDALFPTGFLMDQSAVQHEIAGSAADPLMQTGQSAVVPLKHADWPFAYSSLYLAQRLDAQGLRPNGDPAYLVHPSKFELLAKNEAASVAVPLHLTWLKVNSLDSFAVDSGYLNYNVQTGQLEPMPGKEQWDPLNIATISHQDTFALALKSVRQHDVFIGGTHSPLHYLQGNSGQLTFSLPHALLQTNVDSILKYEVDFADGKGFVRVYPGQVYTVKYQTSSKRPQQAFKHLRIRGYRATSVQVSTVTVSLVFNAPNGDLERLTSSLPNPTCMLNRLTQSDAKMTVRYGRGSNTLQRPVVVVEGFESSKRPYGDITYQAITSGVITNRYLIPVHQQVKKLRHFYDSLYAEGYDLIHLDFEHSQDPIEEHAQHLLKVINWINEHNPKAKITVIGASMGGLVARYALNQMQRSDCCFNVLAYGAFDTPHRGAFIPVGLQAQVRRMGINDPITPGIKSAWDDGINAASARQMLLHHADSTAALDRQSFAAKLGDDLPRGIKSFTAINGSDLARSYALTDALGRIADRPKTTQVTTAHFVGTTFNTLYQNVQGGMKSTVTKRINRSQIHRHASPWLFEYGRATFAKRMQLFWLSGLSARGAFLLKAATGVFPSYASYLDSTIVKLQNATNVRLDSLTQSLEHLEEHVSQNQFVVDYAELPGSYTSSAESIDLLPGYAVYSEGHCFVPSFSALNVSEAFASQPLRNRMDLIPFDAYYAPGLLKDGNPLNEEHVKVGAKNIAFMLDQVRSVYRTWAPKGVLHSAYNIARVHGSYGAFDSHIDFLEVLPGATLALAGQGRVRGQSATAPLAASEQHVSVYVGSPCRPGQLKVSGTLTLGADSHSTAHLVLQSTSVVRLSAGAVLRIDTGSILEIGPDAQLILEPGSKFILNGGMLMWNGEVLLNSGATWQPEGSGVIAIGSDAQLVAGTGSAVAFGQSGKMTLAVSDTFNWPKQLDYCILDSTKVLLSTGASLSCAAPLLMNHSSFTCTVPEPAFALYALGPSLDLKNTTFFTPGNGVYISANCASTIYQCKFEHCETAINAKKALLSLKGCSFGQCGLAGELVGGPFSIAQCVVEQCASGFVINGGTAPVHFEDNQFIGNSLFAVRGIDAPLQFSCNLFEGNETGIIQEGDSLVLATNAGNLFKQNNTAVQLNNVQSLQLQNGQNNFLANTTADLTGSVSPSVTLPLQGGVAYLNLSNNVINPNKVTLLQGVDTLLCLFGGTTLSSSITCPNKSWTGKQEELLPQPAVKAFRIVPNPSSGDEIWVEVPQVEVASQLSVYNSMGQIIKAVQIEPRSARILLSLDVPAGFYSMQLLQGEERYTAQWIKL